MLTTKRLLLGLLVLGVVGMHGLVTSSGTTAAHHGWTAASAATSTLSTGSDPAMASMASTATDAAHDIAAARTGQADTMPATSAMPAQHGPDGDESTTALALCMVLLLAFGVAAFGGRRTTWVAALVRTRTHISLPLPPVLRDSTPVPRFTVMRC
jgi:hypothetical protein